MAGVSVHRVVAVAALGLVLSIVPYTTFAGDLLGTDFVTGAASVDATRYLNEFLGRASFELNARWTRATFLVRDTDANGEPLLGPSAAGTVEGSLLAYRMGFSYRLAPRFTLFAVGDYFVASHLADFFDLLTPSKVSPGSAGNPSAEYYLNWFVPLGLFNGGSRSGFAARAFQVLPGVEVVVPLIGLRARAGYIFKYRDAIDADGRFISRFYLKDFPSDYRSSSDIPDGREGIDRREFFFAASVFGVDADLLLTPEGVPAYLNLAANLVRFLPSDSRLRAVVPYLSYYDELSQNRRTESLWSGRVDTAFDVRVARRDVRVGTRFDWLYDPVEFERAALELGYRFVTVGLSLQDHITEGYLWGARAGLNTPIGMRSIRLSADVRWNYIDSGLGALEIQDAPIFTILAAVPVGGFGGAQ